MVPSDLQWCVEYLPSWENGRQMDSVSPTAKWTTGQLGTYGIGIDI